MFANVNENDAMAAVKVWSALIAKERGVPTDPTPRVYNNLQEMRQALTAKTVDSIALNTEEYWNLQPLLDDQVFIVGSNDDSFTEEYVVLVHRDSEIQRIQDLRGRRLNFYTNPRMTLAPTWLDTMLIKEGLPRSPEFFRLTDSSKISNVVLPVFFRQTDACVVTRNSFKTMCELNPQLGQHLKVVLSSPELVPSGFCFRRGYNDSIRQVIITELVQVMSSASGNQMMTLFQLGKFEAKTLSCLDSAFELLATHQRLLGETQEKP
ncbi:MAG: PhnD/SsuA/transferrin family substrate-binding protein [Syntrophotaleaceae bacterium]